MLLTKKKILKMVSDGLLVQDLLDNNIQIQQCGIDLTMSKLYALDGIGQLDFTNENRLIPEYKEIKPEKTESGIEQWKIKPGVYHIGMNEKIILPENIAGIVFPRSSALTCGIEIHSALWDPGYIGRGFIHMNISREVTILKNARVAQIVFMKVDGKTEPYKGIYKNEDITYYAKRGNPNI